MRGSKPLARFMYSTTNQRKYISCWLGVNFVNFKYRNFENINFYFGSRQQIRYKSSLKNYKNKQVIIEQDPEAVYDSSEVVFAKKIRHFMRTNDISKEERTQKLKEVLSDFVDHQSNKAYSEETILLIGNAFLQVCYNHSIFSVGSKKDLSDIFEMGFLMRLFNKTYHSIIQMGTESSVSKKLPEYIQILSRYFQACYPDKIDNETMASVIYLISSQQDISLTNCLESFMNESKSIDPQLFSNLIGIYEDKKMLKVSTFEQIMDAIKSVNYLFYPDNKFFEDYIHLIEATYKENIPKVHEIEEIDKNIINVQNVTLDLINNIAIKSSIEYLTAFRLIRLAYQLDLAHKNPQTFQVIDRVLMKFQITDQKMKERNTMSVEDIINKFEVDDSELLESCFNILLLMHDKYKGTLKDIGNVILKDEVNFSLLVRFQYDFYSFLHNSSIKNEELFTEIYKRVSEVIEQSADKNTSYMEDILEKAAFIITYICDPHTALDLINKLVERLENEHDVESPIYCYKHIMDRAICDQDVKLACQVFDLTTTKFIKWPGESDPLIRSTLFSFIILLCENFDHVNKVFPYFVKVKQHLIDTPCSPEVIRAIALKMLQAEYVGDTIEMLKRELPKFDTESAKRLPSEGVVGKSYMSIFDVLFKFVIEYKNESTFETNWVLYGELHKYFEVPFESYLPAIKFFCEQDRLNAALIIFRQMRKLNELHGIHKNLPPSREIYYYLFQVFGDKLYQEGVEELHEYLKLELSLSKHDIQLQNCLLNAYSNLQDVGKANNLFLAMSTVPKEEGGINEETIQIMIKTFTYADIYYVQKFWNNLSSYGILPDYRIYRQYLISHVYYGLTDEAFELVESMSDYDLSVNADTIATLYNYCLEPYKQHEVEKWASERYPEYWENVISEGRLKKAMQIPDENLIQESNSKSK